MADVGVVEAAFWRDRRVLVTGHTGFKGSWLSLWLLSMGARVAGLSRGVPSEPNLFALARLGDDVEHLEADVRDPAAVERALRAAAPEVVLHLAAQPLVRRSLAEPRETYETNVMGTVNVLEAVRTGGDVRAVVTVTSDKCYENREWEWGYREDEAKGGRDPYSSSKGAAELVAASYRRSYGLPLSSGRAGNVIGGGDWAADRLVPDLVRCGLAGGEAEIRNPDSVRPWQHVVSPLSGYLVLAQALHERGDAVAEAFNFGPDESDDRPVRGVVERIAELWPGGLRWRIADGANPPEAGILRLDSARARTRLGWRPTCDLDTGLEATVRWHVAIDEGADAREVTLEQIRVLGGHAAA